MPGVLKCAFETWDFPWRHRHHSRDPAGRGRTARPAQPATETPNGHSQEKKINWVNVSPRPKRSATGFKEGRERICRRGKHEKRPTIAADIADGASDVRSSGAGIPSGGGFQPQSRRLPLSNRSASFKT